MQLQAANILVDARNTGRHKQACHCPLPCVPRCSSTHDALYSYVDFRLVLTPPKAPVLLLHEAEDAACVQATVRACEPLLLHSLSSYNSKVTLDGAIHHVHDVHVCSRVQHFMLLSAAPGKCNG